MPSKSCSHPDPAIWDGRFANIAWLQELPKPLTKITWDNVDCGQPGHRRRTAACPMATRRGHGRRPRACVARPGSCQARRRARSRFHSAMAAAPAAKSRPAAVTTPFAVQPGEIRPGSRAAASRASDGAASDRHDAGAPPHGRLRFRARGHGAQARTRRRRRTTHASIPTGTSSRPDETCRRPRLGHGDRSRSLHRLQRLRLGLQRREQRAGGRQGSGRARPRDALAAGRPLLHRRRRKSDELFPAGALHALREGAVRDGLPGPRHGAFAGRRQPDGLQPLHRHAHLLELLPLQGAALQLVRLPPFRRSRAGREKSGRHRALARRHGEVHLLHAAHRGRARAGRQGEPRRSAATRSSPPASRPARPRRSCSAISRTTSRRSRSGARSGRHYVLLEELGTRPRTTYLARWNDDAGKESGA